MTMNATWGVGLIIALAYIPVIFPFVINQRTLDITYLANQLALTLWLGPWCNPAVDPGMNIMNHVFVLFSG